MLHTVVGRKRRHEQVFGTEPAIVDDSRMKTLEKQVARMVEPREVKGC
jgi:hypothetical protein